MLTKTNPRRTSDGVCQRSEGATAPFSLPGSLSLARLGLGLPSAARAAILDDPAMYSPRRLGRATQPFRASAAERMPAARFVDRPVPRPSGRTSEGTRHVHLRHSTCCGAAETAPLSSKCQLRQNAVHQRERCEDRSCSVRTCTGDILHLRTRWPDRKKEVPFRHPLLKTSGWPSGRPFFFSPVAANLAAPSARRAPTLLNSRRRRWPAPHPSLRSLSRLAGRRWRRRRKPGFARSSPSTSLTERWSR